MVCSFNNLISWWNFKWATSLLLLFFLLKKFNEEFRIRRNVIPMCFAKLRHQRTQEARLHSGLETSCSCSWTWKKRLRRMSAKCSTRTRPPMRKGQNNHSVPWVHDAPVWCSCLEQMPNTQIELSNSSLHYLSLQPKIYRNLKRNMNRLDFQLMG